MSHGSEKRLRTNQLTVRLSPEERATIDEAADRAGLTPSSYARQILLDAPVPRQGRRPPLEKRELARLLGELGHIGSNLNQIAREMNRGDGFDPMEVGRALGIIVLLRDQTLKALGRDL